MAKSGGGQHLWEGPRSSWLGGIKANYDWRPIEPLRQSSKRPFGLQAAGGEEEGELEYNPYAETPRRSRGESPQKEQEVQATAPNAVSPYHSLSVNDPQNVMGNRWVDQELAPRPASPMRRTGSRTSSRRTGGTLGI
jgi:hypothetical protein